MNVMAFAPNPLPVRVPSISQNHCQIYAVASGQMVASSSCASLPVRNSYSSYRLKSDCSVPFAVFSSGR